MPHSLEKNFITSKQASELSGYSSDYLARLCRSEKIRGERVGRAWLIDRDSLESFVRAQGDRKIDYARALAREREKEYRASQSPVAKVKKTLTTPLPVASLSPARNAGMREVVAIAAAIAVVGGGAFVAHGQVLPELAARTLARAQEASVGFGEITSTLANKVVARIDESDAQIAAARDASASRVADATRALAREELAQPNLSRIAMQIDSTRVAQPTMRPMIAMRMQPTISFTLPTTAQAIEFVSSPSAATSVAVDAYRTLGAVGYESASVAKRGSVSLLDSAGNGALGIGITTRDLIASSPRLLAAAGGAFVDLTHFILEQEVRLVYATSAAAPESARLVVAFAGNTGSFLAFGTAQAPYIARDLALGGAEMLAEGGPKIAQAVFDVEYALAVPFVKDTQAVLYAYARTLEITGDITSDVAIGGTAVTKKAIAFIPNAGTHVENLALGTLGKGAVALDALANDFANTRVGKPIVAIASQLAAKANTQLAAAVEAASPALSVGQQAALATYTTISGWITSTNRTLATLFGPPAQVVMPSGPAPARLATISTTTPQVATISHPSYTTIVNGISEAYVAESLSLMRAGILSDVTRMLQPVQNQIATNVTTIQQVNMIDRLGGLEVDDGIIRRSDFLDGKTVSANKGEFTNLTAGDLLTTNGLVVNGNVTFNGSFTSSASSIAPYFTATSTTATSTFAGAFAVGSNGVYTNGLFSVGTTTAPLLFVHSTSGKVGVGTSSPAVSFDIYATDAIRLPVGTTAQRPSGGDVGFIRYNTTTQQFEGYGTSGSWQSIGGGSLIDADQDTYITADTNSVDEDYLRFFTAGTQRMSITNQGLIGIASTSPFAKFSIHLNATDSLENAFAIGSSTASATSTLFVVKNDGKVGIGTTTPGSTLSVAGGVSIGSNYGSAAPTNGLSVQGSFLLGSPTSVTQTGSAYPFQMHGTSAAGASMSITRWQNTTNGPGINLNNSRGTTVGTHVALQNDDPIGGFLFGGDDGTDFIRAAGIHAYVDGTPGTNDMPGRLVFSTTADGASSATERLRINSSGQIGIASTSPWGLLSVNPNVLGTGVPEFVIGSSSATHFIVNGTGNVGIGTINPSTGKLVIADGGTGSISSELLTLQTSYGANGATKALTWRDGGTGGAGNITGQIDTRYDGSTVDMIFGSLFSGSYNSTERFRIKGTGNVGVASSSPWGLFSVNPSVIGSGVPEFVIGSSSATHFLVDGGGNVGIGTAAPTQKLTVNNGNILVTGSSGPYTVNLGDTNWGIRQTNASNQFFTDVIGAFGANSGGGFRVVNKVGGTESVKMVVDYNGTGNVGIGTTTPQATLSVVKSGSGGITGPTSGTWASVIVNNNDTTAYNGLSVQNRWANTSSTIFEAAAGWNGSSIAYVPVFTINGLGQVVAKPISGGDSTTAFQFQNSSGTTIFDIDTSNTRIGIGSGITSPVTTLQVSPTVGAPASSGNVNTGVVIANGTGGPSLNLGNYNSGGTYYSWIQSAFVNNAGVVQPLVLQQIGGNVGIGSTTPWGQLSVNPNVLGSGVPEFVIGSSSATHFLVDGGGNVGIGISTTPAEKLQVNGNIRYTEYLLSNQSSYFGKGSTLVSGGGASDTAVLTAGNILFATNAGAGNTERVRITSAGLVGIGNSSPQNHMLHIASTSAGVMTNGILLMNRSDTTNTGIALNFITSGNDFSDQRYNSIASVNTGSGTALTFSLSAGAAPTERMRIMSSTGYIGIGTSSPADLLSIAANSAATAGLRINNSNAAGYATIYMGNSGGLTNVVLFANGTSNSAYGGVNSGGIGTNNATPFVFLTSGSERMRIDSAGKVGIGTSPSSILDIRQDQDNYTTVNIRNATNGASAYAGILLGNSSDTQDGQILLTAAANSSYAGARSMNFVSNVGAFGFFRGYTTPATTMLLDTSGNVRISGDALTQTARLMARRTTGTTEPIAFFEAAIGSYTGTTLTVANTLGAASTYNLFQAVTDSDGDAGGITTQFVIRGDGNVGIGASSPTNGKLHIAQSSASSAAIYVGMPTASVNTTGAVRVQGYSPSIELIDKDSVQNWYFGIDDNDSNTLKIARGYGPNQGITPVFAATASDNVGFGTSTPNPYKVVIKANANNIVGGLAIASNGTNGDGLIFGAINGTRGTIGYSSNLSNGASSASEVISILSSGNVGIGTTNPGALFTVNGTASTTNLTISGITNGSGQCLQINSAGVVSGTGSACGGSGSTPGGSSGQVQYNSGGTFAGASALYYDSGNSRVGIGTNVPAHPLHVSSGSGGFYPVTGQTTWNSAVFSNNMDSTIRISHGAASSTLWTDNSSQAMNFATNGMGNSRLFITGTGNIGVGTTSPWGLLSVNPTATLAGAPEFVVGSSSATHFVITGGGFVGIGTASPVARLVVQGTTDGGGNTGAMQIRNGSLNIMDRGDGFGANLRLSGNNSVNASVWDFYSELSTGDLRFYQVTNAAGSGVGTDRLVLDNTGNIGIGTASPGSTLHVSGASSATITVTDTTNNYDLNLFCDDSNCLIDTADNTSIIMRTQSTDRLIVGGTGRIGVASTSPWGLLSVNPNALGSGVPEFVIGSSSATHLIVTGGGNVGIGTTNPLTVASGAQGDPTQTMLSVASAGVGVLQVSGATDARLILTDLSGSADHKVLRLKNDAGNFYIEQINDAYSSVPATPFTITTAGNVGIGTTSPVAFAGYTTLAASGSTGSILVLGSSGTNFGSNIFYDSNGMGVGSLGSATPIRFKAGVIAGGTDSHLFIATSGNIGIGTTTPTAKLQVTSDVSSVPDSGTYGQLELSLATTPLKRLKLGYSSGEDAGYVQAIHENAAYKSLLLNPSGGNVGVGSTTPWGKLSVNPTLLGTGVPEFVVGSSTATHLIVNGTGYTGLNGITNPQAPLDIGGVGSVGALGYAAAGTDLVAGRRINFWNGNTDHTIGMGGGGLFFTGNTNIRFDYKQGTSASNGTTRFYIDMANSKVGIGTTSPLATLDVTTGTSNTSGDVPSDAVITGADNPISNATANLFVWTNSAQAINRGGSMIFGGRYVDSSTAGAAFATIKGAKENGTSGNLDAYLAFATRKNAAGFTEGLRISSSAFVGVGTTSPWGKLSVNPSVLGTGVPEFVVGSSSATHLIVDGTGNVGIGTAAPGAPLTISGSNRAYADWNETSTNSTWRWVVRADNGAFQMQDITSGGLTSVTIEKATPSGTIYTTATTGKVGIGTTTPWGKLSVNPSVLGTGVPEFVVGSSSATHFIVTGGGKVGINGATSPTADLQIGNDDAVLQFGGAGSTGSGQHDIQFYSSSAERARFRMYDSGPTDVGFSFWTTGTSGSISEKMRLTGPGLLGIGSTTPWGLLSVNPNALGSGVPEFVVGSSTATRFIITGSGNVGVGTASPTAAQLQVETTTGTGIASYRTDSIQGTNFDALNFGKQNASGQSAMIRYSYDTTTPFFTLFHNGDSQASGLTVQKAGNVGIGTTTPNQKLTVSKAGHASIRVENTTNGNAVALNAGTGGVGMEYSNDFYFLSRSYVAAGDGGGTSQLVIKQATGYVGIATTTPADMLTVDGAIRSVSNSADFNAGDAGIVMDYVAGSGVTQRGRIGTINGAGSGAGGLAFLTNGNEVARFDTSGNLGIGTSTPSYTLDVYGASGGNVSSRVRNATAGGGSYAQMRVENDTFTAASLLMTSSSFTTSGAYVQSGAAIDSAGAGGISLIAASGSGAIRFATAGSADANIRMTIGSNGRIGIASTTPWGLLSVNPSIIGSGIPSFVVGSSTKTQFVVDGNGNVGIGTAAPTAIATFTVLELAGTGGSMVNWNYNGIRQGTAYFDSQSFNVGSQSVVPFGLQSAGVVRATFDTSGNFGIGTTSPLSKLSVEGFISASSGYNMWNQLLLYASSTNQSTILGIRAGGNNATTSGSALDTVAIGYRSLDGLSSGTRNVAVGSFAGASGGSGLSTGGQNVAIGYLAMFNSGAASQDNVAIGSNALNINGNTLGDRNVSIGSKGNGSYAVTGSGNIEIGAYVVTASTTGSGYLNIGNVIYGTGMYNTASQSSTPTAGGLIGIGTTTPVSTLSVQGSLCVRSTGSCGTTAGTIYATTAAITDIDLAENYQTTDSTLTAGELVAFDTSTTAHVKRAAPGDSVIGIVSTAPGVVLGKEIGNSKPIALAGRVPVKVNMEGGPIAIGDRIALSSVAGVGTKAASSTRTVGIALEGATSDGTIEVFVKSEYTFASSQFTVDGTTGNVGIGTNTPTHTLDVIGDVAAISFVNTSTRDSKTDIMYLSTQDAESALQKLQNLKVAEYRYKIEPNTNPLRLGFIAEDAAQIAPEILAVGGKGVDVYKLATFTIAGVQALAVKVNAQQTRLASLEDRVAALESGSISSASGTSFTSFSSSTLASALSGFGAFIKNGIAQFGILIADQFVAATNSAGTSSAGTVQILAGNTVALVQNAYVLPSSKIFVTFTASTTGSWYVSEKQAGSFKVTLSQAQAGDVSFDYFIVQTQGQVATSTPSGGFVGSTGTGPVTITVIGDNPAYVAVGAAYQDAGVSITGAAVTTQVFVDGIEQPEVTIDTSSAATHIITYSVTDSSGNTINAHRAVTVGDPDGTGAGSSGSSTSSDTTAPVVTLTGDAAIQLTVGDTFTDPGATALDDIDGDLTASIAVTGSVDTATTSMYTLTYSATDAAGNTGSASRVVTVVQ